ncbi:MAG: hypothetical protein LBL63_01055 [Clostridiales Family XIII bacterium]|jgi:hypothetical protein|nr:hypothetical protein [Clostridiales Family XIII bacterium]
MRQGDRQGRTRRNADTRGDATAIRRRATTVALAVLILITGLLSGGCSVFGTISKLVRTAPTEENTLTSLQAVNDAIVEALMEGEKEITMNLVATEDEISEITENLDPFWGSPTKYSVLAQFKDIRLSDDASAASVNVLRINFELKPSVSYYVYRRMKDVDFVLPADQPEAAAVAEALPGILDEIYTDIGAAAYERVLAAHDWIVAHLTYDVTIRQTGFENGVYGALINRRTMCQGYAEALQLILLCGADVRVRMEIGDGNNGDGQWVGHAWNLVYMDDRWYQVDATFDDPIGNPEGRVDHSYFGQNDALMQNDHRWDALYWPAADGADFLYYRKAGLYAEDLDTFKSIARNQLEGRRPSNVEIAIRGFKPAEDDLRFLYDVNNEIEVIYRRTTQVGDVSIISIEPEYQQ